jgi:glycosyltransferase involved in cell wall biosynthesis
MRALYAYSRWINRRADLIVCATRGTLHRYMRDGEPEDKLRFVPVWIRGVPESLEPFNEAAKDQTIVYAGNLGPAQCLRTVITAAARLRDSRPRLRFELYGSGVSEHELRLQADAEGATNLFFKGRVPPERAFAASAAALAQIVSLAPTPLFRATIPSKLAFALAAGSPLLCGLEGEAAAIATDSGAAFSYSADSPESLVQTIHALIDSPAAKLKEMRENARRYYLRHFERRRLMAHYRELLLDLARRDL